MKVEARQISPTFYVTEAIWPMGDGLPEAIYTTATIELQGEWWFVQIFGLMMFSDKSLDHAIEKTLEYSYYKESYVDPDKSEAS